MPNPSNPQAFNRYSYVNNNPLNYIDPSGHCRIVDGEYQYDTDCTVDEYAELDWEQRKQWMNDFMADTEVKWFYNIIGIIDYFANDPEFSDLDGWASYADAGVLQAVQDGWRLHNGDAAIGGSGAAWKDFFDAQENFSQPGSALSESDVKSKWGTAEQAGVDYGFGLAGDRFELSLKANYFTEWGNAYRWMVSNEVWNWGVAGSAISDYLDPRTRRSENFVREFSVRVISGSYSTIHSEVTRPYGPLIGSGY